MNKITNYTALVFIVTFTACDSKTKTENTETTSLNNMIFPRGEKITNNNFTGTAWLSNLIQSDSINQNSVGNVTFEPGARTKWHAHPAGQILLVTNGVGYYQEKGGVKKILRKGDVIKCAPNVSHWHGASADTMFVQLAITGREKGETVWMEEVTDADYNN
ncbi:cupin domain-containing protein [Terrimonas sp. NA20]|uniref:Cupin domain-containing protein n=1 Tax=Terrimonas ginsenosidimutans TaxID=2908004 RepID=A0ABS9KMH6_9BACT|nr:cupin domain-containing protein [Terrimonas ginsenosidimutans]MCG2613528.1 cupin domain-containing protein [Terrimonas ginsenosidimutans]